MQLRRGEREVAVKAGDSIQAFGVNFEYPSAQLTAEGTVTLQMSPLPSAAERGFQEALVHAGSPQAHVLQGPFGEGEI